jgi:hypothetical protein
MMTLAVLQATSILDVEDAGGWKIVPFDVCLDVLTLL